MIIIFLIKEVPKLRDTSNLCHCINPRPIYVLHQRSSLARFSSHLLFNQCALNIFNSNYFYWSKHTSHIPSTTYMFLLKIINSSTQLQLHIVQNLRNITSKSVQFLHKCWKTRLSNLCNAFDEKFLFRKWFCYLLSSLFLLEVASKQESNFY